MTIELLNTLRASLAATIAPGELELATPFEIEGVLAEVDELEVPQEAALAALGSQVAAVNGKPRVMVVDAWMAHAGVFNSNGHGFTEADLEEVGATLFRPPYLGVMDWNHSSVLMRDGDPAMIGVWYESRYEYDPMARAGEGAYGLRVRGMVFSWLFPEQASRMVEEQAKNGRLRFSMMCLYQAAESQTWHGREGKVLRKPIFFGNAVMTKPQADPDAFGRATWDEPKESQAALIAGALATQHEPAAGPTEDARMEEKLKELEAMNADLRARVDALVAAHDQQVSAEALAALQSEVAAAQKRAVELEASVEALRTANEALTAELAAVQEAHTALLTERAEAQAKLDAIEAQAASVAKQELVEKRLAELGEDFLKAHAKRDEAKRLKVEERFASLTDEQWEEEKELLGLAATRVSYAQRTALEGRRLPYTAGTETDSIKDKIAALIAR